MSENLFLNDLSGAQTPVRSNTPVGTDFNELLNNLNARLQYLEVQNRSTPVVNHGLSPKVSLPEKFSGSITKFRDFLISVENIFALQPGRYGSDQIKTRFIGTLLTNEALSWFRDVVLNKAYLLDNYI
jgi:hypothetical protein